MPPCSLPAAVAVIEIALQPHHPPFAASFQMPSAGSFQIYHFSHSVDYPLTHSIHYLSPVPVAHQIPNHAEFQGPHFFASPLQYPFESHQISC